MSQLYFLLDTKKKMFLSESSEFRHQRDIQYCKGSLGALAYNSLSDAARLLKDIVQKNEHLGIGEVQIISCNEKDAKFLKEMYHGKT